MTVPRVLPVGDAALSLELGDTLDPARARACGRSIWSWPARRSTGFRESVPTHRSLLVLYDATVARFSSVARILLSLAASPAPPPPPGRLHEVPVVYGGEDGPDLAALAAERGLAPGDVVRLHAATEYTAFMLGFTPGFAYLGLLPEALESPRHATPRVRVPAGSVALAGRQTGVYPVASPGGWQIVGRTSRRLFDPFREEPALVAPGDRVRFVPVAELPPPESRVGAASALRNADRRGARARAADDGAGRRPLRAPPGGGERRRADGRRARTRPRTARSGTRRGPPRSSAP